MTEDCEFHVDGGRRTAGLALARPALVPHLYTVARNYNDSEVDAILERALREQGDIHHEDLVAAAAEIGVSREAIERAADRLDERTEEAELVAEAREKRKLRFKASMMTFVIVNLFLFAIDMLTTRGPWFYWPLLSWGMLMALQGSKLLQPEPVPKALVKRRRQARKAARKLAKKTAAEDQRKKRTKAAAKRFEDAVDGGVSALFDALAKRIEGVIPPAEGEEADGEFARYVARKTGKGVRAPDAENGKRQPRQPPPARVANFGDEDYSEEELADAERELERELNG